jgi:putative acetyltransferase
MQETTSVVVRSPKAGEEPAIAAVVEAAFKGNDEARLIALLRQSGDMLLERVAVDGGDVLGHIAFSRVSVIEGDTALKVAALAPLAVRPDLQRRGIGSALVRDGLEQLREAGEEIVVVVGDTAYYPRFGFETALGRLITAPWSGPAFMALELASGATDRLPATVAFARPFSLFE